MSKQKHKGYRRVLKIERVEKQEGSIKVPVTIVLWAIVERENSKSIFTSHLGVTVYAGGAKHSGVTAWTGSKTFRVPKSLEGSEQVDTLLDRRRLSQPYTHAIYSYLGGKHYTGTLSWLASDGQGIILCDKTGLNHVFYLCNAKGANSSFEDRVTNIKLKSGDKVKFKIHKDPFVSAHCGATEVEKA